MANRESNRTGARAVSLETREVKAALSAMPVKSDRNDARGIAQLVRTGWFQVCLSRVSAAKGRYTNP